MKRAVIFCFSGTGNTDRVMNLLTEELGRRGVSTDCFRIDECLAKAYVPDISGYDAVGIGYPVYAFNVPAPVARFVETLPEAEHKPLFVFKTAGEPFLFNEPSSFFIYAKLRRKGYDFCYERLFLMPYNILFRYEDGVVRQIALLSRSLSRRMASDLAAGVSNRPRFRPVLVLISLILRIQWPGAALNGRLQRAGKTCSLCRKCIRECRTGNIRLENGRIRFGWKCCMCMRCVMYCPRQAIRAGLLEHWAVRGAYDFDRILNDPAIPGDAIGRSKKGMFRHFRKYVRQVEALTAQDCEPKT